MNKQEYLNKRNTLLAKMRELIENNASDDEINDVKGEIETLDNNFRTQATRMANMNALADNAVVSNLEDSSVVVEVVGSANVGGAVSVTDDAAHYENAFAKMMMGIPMNAAETTAFAKFNPSFSNDVNTAANNPAVIPAQRAEEIWSEMRASHPIIEAITPKHFAGTFEFMKGEIKDSDNEWYDETDTVDESEFKSGLVSLTGCELSKTVPISWKLKKMSVKDFYNWLVRELGAKMGDALAKGYIMGLGKPGDGENFKPQPKGIITELKNEAGTPQIVTYVEGEELAYSLLTTARGKIKSGYVPAVYASSETIWGTLANILDKVGRPIFINDPLGKGVGSILGSIVKEESAIPAGCVLFGDAVKGYEANVADDMSVTIEDKPTQRKTNYVGYMIVDGAPRTSKAFSYIMPATEAAVADDGQTEE